MEERTPTLWCTIQRVQARPSWWSVRVAVTVANREGIAVTLVLRPTDLATYTGFQTAVLRATGSPFRYLPDTVPRVFLAAQPAALTRIEGHRLADVLHTLKTMALRLKSIVNRVLGGASVEPAE
jgi:hypothetical protein